MLKWEDITSYRRGENKEEPRSVMTVAGSFKVVVTRINHLEGWFVRINGLFNQEQLISTTLVEAKKEACLIFRQELISALKLIDDEVTGV